MSQAALEAKFTEGGDPIVRRTPGRNASQGRTRGHELAPLRALNINSYHYRRGGSDAVYLEHAAMLQSLGWECGYFSMHHPENFPTPWSRHFVDMIELGMSYSAADKAKMAMKVIYSWEARRKLKSLLEEFHPDVAHLHCIYHHLSPSILPVLKERGIPTVLTTHELKIACPAYTMRNASGVCEQCKSGNYLNVVANRCIKGSFLASMVVAAEAFLHGWLRSYAEGIDRFVTPSKFFLEKFVQWGWPRNQFVYIPNFVDCESYSPSTSVGSEFLYFGRLSAEKGLETLLRASAKARVRVVLVGTGPMEGSLRALANQLGVDVDFKGYLSGEPLHEAVRQCRGVVLASEWYENAPISILESYALGKPVIGADIGGIPELIQPGETGWLFPSRDVDALAARLADVRAMPESRLSGMGAKARAYVATEFNRARYQREILDLYRSLGVRC